MNLWSRVSRARRGSEKKSFRERGAALVEFALVAPLFFLVVFGGIELGLMARSTLTVQDASRTAVRTAAIERAESDADAAILEAVQRRLTGLNGRLERVIIFKADTLASELPAACAGGANLDNLCTTYNAAHLEAVLADPMLLTDPMLAAAAGFPAAPGFTTAQRVDTTGNNEIINIGIHIDYTYQFVTGFFDTTTISSTSIEVVELSLG